MNKRIAVALGGVIAISQGGAALAGVPAWCKDASLGSDRYDLKDLSAKDPSDVIVTFAKAVCTPTPEATAGAAEIEKSRQAWSKKLNMVDADWADAVAFAKAGGRPEHLEMSTKDISAFTPLDQYVAITEGFRRPGGNMPFQDVFYIADVLERNLSEVGRFAFIDQCLKLGERSVTSIPSVTWALCQGDIEKFDATKFSDQLRADTAHGGEHRMWMRLRTLDLPTRLKEHTAQVEAMFKKDDAYKKVFDVVAKARTEWTTTLGTDAKLLELAQGMDTAALFQSRKAFEGCQAKTSAALIAAVSKVPAKAFANMYDVRMDPYKGFAYGAGPLLVKIPAVNLAAIPFMLCHKTTGTADFLAYYLQETPGQRGPRTAALMKILYEPVVLDDLNAKLQFPDYGDRPYSRSGGSLASAGGVISKVKAEANSITVDLEKLLVKRTECVASHLTNRISRILDSGTIQYESVCDKSGVVTHDETWAAFKINKEFAPVLKKGAMFSSVNAANGSQGDADVIAIWPSGKAALPTQVLGATVK